MEKITNKQEILLVPSTAAKIICDNTGPFCGNRSPADQLEEAVWSGMLSYLLGDLVECSEAGTPLNLWQVRQGDAILEIELCDYPVPLERVYSIDPYVFMYEMMWN